MAVSSIYAPYRLTFLLPDHLVAFVRPGVHQPCLAGVLLTIGHGGLVHVDGRDRRAVFEQTRRFFRVVAKDRPAFIVSANLVTPERRREAWEMAINSDVTFTRDIAPVISSELADIGNPHG
jgi:hypothetical protein